MLCHRPRVVEKSNIIATHNIASYNVIRRPAQTPARTRNALRCHWGLWDALSARGLNRKRHPGLKVKSGEQLPPEDRFGKGIPFWSQKLGRSFRQACHPESVSRSEPEFWDELSTEASTGKCIPFRGLILGCTFRGETTVFRKSTRPETYPVFITCHRSRSPITAHRFGCKKVAENRPSTCMVRFWSAFGQLSGKLRLIRFCYPKGGGSS